MNDKQTMIERVENKENQQFSEQKQKFEKTYLPSSILECLL